MHQIIDDGAIIRVIGKGFYTEDGVREHFANLSRVVASRRRAGRQVKALADLRQAATQSATTARMITEATQRLYSDPSDRVAVVVSSVLLKLQLERVHQHQGFGIFLDMGEAERYLTFAPSVVGA